MKIMEPAEFAEKYRNSPEYKIPSSREIVAELINELERNGELERKKVRKNFDSLIEDLQIQAYHKYLDYEEKSAGKFVRDYFKPYGARGGGAAVKAFAKHFRHIDKLCLSLTQSRRSRAGDAFEDILTNLFMRLNYPFDRKPVINGRPDFLLPSKEYYGRNAMDCIIFTSKRSLRERWRQIVTEGTRGLGFYLATIDEKVSSESLKEMKEHRIYLVVPSRIRTERYLHAVNVLSFGDFFTDHLDPKVKIWKRRGIIDGGKDV